MTEPPEIDEPVELSPYDERWPTRFESEKNRIVRALAASTRRALECSRMR